MHKANLIQTFQKSFQDHFELPALTNYHSGYELSYGQLAQEIARLHCLYQKLGIQSGDHIALLGKDSAQWAVVFMATITYGAVVVPILQDFSPSDAVTIINHSDSILLFVDAPYFKHIDPNDIPAVRGAIAPEDWQILYWQFNAPQEEGEQILSPHFALQHYPHGFKPTDIVYPSLDNNRVMVINYTSGTTGMSKGVMLTGANLAGNALYAHSLHLLNRGEQLLCFLPLAHAYSCAFNLLTALSVGVHVFILGKVPSPRILLQAFERVRPTLIISVPLILEKIYKQAILPVLKKPLIKFFIKIPQIRLLVYRVILKKLSIALGNNFREVIVGGAPLSREVAGFLHRIGFPLTVGYGITECGPLISYAPHHTWVPESCGKALSIMQVRITEVETQETFDHEVGEIQVRGQNVCNGYYKNPQANEKLFTPDGWMRTGDLGFVDLRGNIYIRGRSKTMILGANGQNIYPEEIEAKINTHPLIAESLVVSRKGRLIALIMIDYTAAKKQGLTLEEAQEQVEQFRNKLNEQLGNYEKVTRFEWQNTPFVKTPKQSIKRYLYQ